MAFSVRDFYAQTGHLLYLNEGFTKWHVKSKYQDIS